MISVLEAKRIVEQNCQPAKAVFLDLDRAFGHILAEDVFAPADIPAFDQSNMDGYAFRFMDLKSGNPLIVDGVVPAGSSANFNLRPQQAVRIFTGAALPGGADTIIMQEKVTLDHDRLILDDAGLTLGSSVRPKGSEIARGKLALPKNSYLNPISLGFLAAMGLNSVKVIPSPSITILVTGKEIRQPGQSLEQGQVYDSNSFMLRSALRQLQIDQVKVIPVDDDLGKLQEKLAESLMHSDLVLLTGGISVGDYDFVLQACKLNQVEQLFHKVKQKPGKPLYFGKKKEKIVFGLPGNPSSVMTCFYEYVVPALEKMTGRENIIHKSFLPLAAPVLKKTGLTHFLKGKISGANVTPLEGQESYRLSSFATANCLIYLEEEKEEFPEGERVEVHEIPA